MPDAEERAQRLSSVLHILYLVFNEGYTASAGSGTSPNRFVERGDASHARRVHKLVPEDPEVAGLLALMLLTDARRAARTGTEW